MASIWDIESAVRESVRNIVYPNGVALPSITKKDVKVRVGWPLKNSIDAAMTANQSIITVFPVKGAVKILPNFLGGSTEQILPPPTLTAIVQNFNEVVIDGIVTVPQAVLVILNRIPYGYLVNSGDSINSIASNLAALIPGATAIGNIITIPDVILLDAKIIVSGTENISVQRIQASYDIFIWTPNAQDREILGSAIQVYFRDATFLPVADGSNLWVVFKSFVEQDYKQLAKIYERQLCYDIQYCTLKSNTYTEIGYAYVKDYEVVASL